MNNYRNLITGYKHPNTTKNVHDAFKMLSKTREGVGFTDTEYGKYPNRVIRLYKILLNHENARDRKKQEKILKNHK